MISNKTKNGDLNVIKKFSACSLSIPNKRGMLLAEETLKIVISVIVISFLVYFLANLYMGKLKDDTIKKSDQLLINSDESIKNTLDSLNDGESKRLSLQEISYLGDQWHLIGFVGNSEKPNACLGKNCLCICNDVVSEDFFKQAEECNKNGICTIAANLKNEEINIELQKDFGTEILISKQNKEVSIKRT